MYRALKKLLSIGKNLNTIFNIHVRTFVSRKVDTGNFDPLFKFSNNLKIHFGSFSQGVPIGFLP